MPKEYIDREKALEITKRTSGDYAAAWSEIRQLPASDVAHVVHGEWVESPKKYSYYQYRCSVCGFDNYSHITRNGVIKLMKYCPNCGAKMDGGDNGTAQT